MCGNGGMCGYGLGWAGMGCCAKGRGVKFRRYIRPSRLRPFPTLRFRSLKVGTSSYSQIGSGRLVLYKQSHSNVKGQIDTVPRLQHSTGPLLPTTPCIMRIYCVAEPRARQRQQVRRTRLSSLVAKQPKPFDSTVYPHHTTHEVVVC